MGYVEEQEKSIQNAIPEALNPLVLTLCILCLLGAGFVLTTYPTPSNLYVGGICLLGSIVIPYVHSLAERTSSPDKTPFDKLGFPTYLAGCLGFLLAYFTVQTSGELNHGRTFLVIQFILGFVFVRRPWIILALITSIGVWALSFHNAGLPITRYDLLYYVILGPVGSYAFFLAREKWQKLTVAHAKDMAKTVEESRSTLQKLQETTAYLGLISEETGLGVWSWLPSEDLVTVDQAWCRILGYDRHEFMFDSTLWERILHPDDKDAMKALLTLQPGNDSWEQECRFQHKDGHYVWAHGRGRVVEWTPDRKPDKLVGLHLDVSQRKEAEARQRELDEQLNQTQRFESLGVLAGGIAHDFNNILMGVTASASLMREECTPEETDELLTNIEESTQRAAELVEQMLLYAGKSQVHQTVLDLSTMCEEMANLLRVSAGRNHRVEFESREIAVMEGDPTQIRQVILNLVTNAADSMSEKTGTITIRTGLQTLNKGKRDEFGQLSQGGEYVYFEVEDEGCGFSPEVRERMFEPFFSTKGMGRGLGLSSIAGILRTHNGLLFLTTVVGQGSCLRVLFPQSEKSPEGERKSGSQAPSVNGMGTVLVVDDETAVRSISARLLGKIGYQTMEAGGGEEAVEIYRDNPQISLIVLDLTMPGLSGQETLKKLREVNPQVRCLLASGYSSTGLEGIEGEHFIQKPFTLDKLRMALRQLDSTGSEVRA